MSTAAERLLALPDLTTLLADVLDKRPADGGVLPLPLLPRTSSRRLCGPAAVLQLRPAAPGERLTHEPLLAAATPGAVGVVVAADAPDAAAVLGGRLARRGLSAGLAGYVVGGAVRDVEDLEDLGLPVWSLGTHPAGARFTLAPDPTATSVTLGGRTVGNGDLVAADANGVVVVAADAAESVSALAEELAAQEASELSQVADREPDRAHERS